MSSSAIRTIVMFGIIALALGGAVVGVVRLTKARNNSYVTSHTSSAVAQTDAQKQPTTQPQQQKNGSNSNPSSSSPQSKSSQPSQSTPQTQAPAPSASDKTTAGATNPQQNKLPQTSAFSPLDFSFTMILVMLAAFFGNKLLRARADYRRYIGS